MPTFITKEQYSCGHVLEICQKRTGDDKFVLTETLPVPYQCLDCVLGGANSADGASPTIAERFSAMTRLERPAGGQAPRSPNGVRPSMAELGRTVAWW